jgi:hypothetical protein
MKAIQEVTKWDLDYQPNHVYLVDGDRMLAYQVSGQEPRYLKTGIRFETGGRKFVEVKNHAFVIKTKSTLIEVKGSKGDTYFVDPEKGTCTCAASKFRGTCKHVKEVLK